MSPRRRNQIAAHLIAKGKRSSFGRIPALPDLPDIRDLPYLPTLAPLKPERPCPSIPAADILDQGKDGACTGFALAGVIHRLLASNTALESEARSRRVSARMLYVMAQLYDEWPGQDYEGSSLRGALRGFFNNGVCAEEMWKNKSTSRGPFRSLQAAQDARRTSLGAYYRLRPSLPDYHAALSETGAIYASAAVHEGWDEPQKQNGVIVPANGRDLHAFAIVGYNATGFWIQNSWGEKWGNGGLAHWPYEDWATNIQDAWVLQLAVEAPRAFGLTARKGASRGQGQDASALRPAPARQEIQGHFVHVRNGDFADKGRYWSTEEDVRATANLVANKEKHRHLLIYAHGGLNTPEAASRRTKAMTPIFMANGIYPYSVFYDTGLAEELTDVLLRRGAASQERAGGVMGDFWDQILESAVGGIGKRLWQEMKADAEVPFKAGRAGTKAIRVFVQALAASQTPTSLHLAGHSTGAILLGHLLEALDREMAGQVSVASCSLMAPACTVDFYKAHYQTRIAPLVSAGKTPIKKLAVYSLTDQDEQDDTVVGIYRKSLLYLVSNAFEKKRRMPILGMERFVKAFLGDEVEYIVSMPEEDEPRSTARGHGDFDNDVPTMNDILKRILDGVAPGRPFTAWDLDYG